MRRFAFTMLELIFVIVILGIIGKFGVELLAQAYRSFVFSNVNNDLQANAQMAVETIASRLQYRIKDSVIGRNSNNFNDFRSIGSSVGNQYNIIEWVGSDIEGFRGDALPNWSGIIDMDNSVATSLNSPFTNTTTVNNLISVLSNNGSDINDSAIFFVGADSDINNYNWIPNNIALATQNNVPHPITADTVTPDTTLLLPRNTSFAGVDVYEYYQLAWTAYAVGIDNYNPGTNTGTLTLWYDYQPWEGEQYDIDGIPVVIMEDVSTFKFKSVGSIIKIQVCANSDLVEDYSLCKEKTIF